MKPKYSWMGLDTKTLLSISFGAPNFFIHRVRKKFLIVAVYHKQNETNNAFEWAVEV